MIIDILNKRLTHKNGEVYEIGKYITLSSTYATLNRKGVWGSTDQYYISGWRVIGAGRDYAQLSLHGRMKGDKSTTGVVGPKLENIQEKIIISRRCADGMRRMAGYGRKPRHVGSTEGYIWLPDFMIFDDPYKILRWACDPAYTHFKEIHDGPPDPPCFPDWLAEEHGFEVYDEKKGGNK